MQRRQGWDAVTTVRRVWFSFKYIKNHELCINASYVFKIQKRAERSETTTLFFKVDPKERLSRIIVIQKVEGCLF